MRNGTLLPTREAQTTSTENHDPEFEEQEVEIDTPHGESLNKEPEVINSHTQPELDETSVPNINPPFPITTR